MIRKLVLDVLKPHEPDLAEFAKKLSEEKGIEGVNVSLYEIDREVENIKVTIRGKMDAKEIEKKIKELGGSVHSIDEASAGKKLVEEAETTYEREGKSEWAK